MARVKAKPAEETIIETQQEKKGGGMYFASPKTDVNFIGSGCKILDMALGGGWARGRVCNIVGDKAVGKTLLAIEACANFNLSVPKGKIRYREAESAFDESYAAALGFPVDKVDRGEPIETIEDVFEDLEKVIEGAKEPELYIIDSLDALSDRGEMQRKIDEGSYGAEKAKKLSQLFRRQIRGLAEKDITLMVISQIRDNLNAGMFAKKHQRSGGKALDFYASQVVNLAQIEKVKKTIGGVTRVVGTWVKASVDKNKISLPYREAIFKILFSYGVDDKEACMEYLKDIKLNFDKAADLQTLHELVETSWFEIERRFQPETLKYGITKT